MGFDFNIPEKSKLTAEELIDEGYFQISRKYRMLAKLPDGQTGIQALIEAHQKRTYVRPDLIRWAYGLGEYHCGDSYLRGFAPAIEVDKETFDEFRKLGGTTYFGQPRY